MQGVLFGTLILVLFLILISGSLRQSSHKSKCGCGCGFSHYATEYNEQAYSGSEPEEAPKSRGLNELQQTPRSRGFLPDINQPDHTSNLWKCDQSHPQMLSNGQQDTIFASDYPTPLRRSMVNLGVDDVSDMHIISRFGSINSI